MEETRSKITLIPILIGLALILAGASCSKRAETAALSVGESISAGLAAFRVFDFAESYSIFEELYQASTPEDDQWPLITYSYGISAWLSSPTTPEGVDQAVQLLEELTQKSPDSIYAASALLDLGRIAEISDYRGDTTDVTKARTYYRRVRQNFPNSEMSTRATIFLAQTYAQTLETDNIHKAIDLLEECIEDQDNDEWIGLIAQYMGELYDFYLDQPDQSIDPYFKATQGGLPQQADTDAMLWRVGVLAQNAGRDLLAVQAYTRILKDFPRTVYRSVSEERLKQIQRKYPDQEIAIPNAK